MLPGCAGFDKPVSLALNSFKGFMKSFTIELLASDLDPKGAVFCPNPKADMALWNSHPKVYLDVAHTGQAKCPYCGTVYKLKDGEHFGGGH